MIGDRRTNIDRFGFISLLMMTQNVETKVIVSKIMEHLIADDLMDLLNKVSWFWQEQHGFRKGYSCERQLAALYLDLVEGLDNGSGPSGGLDNGSGPSGGTR
jgi:hypothetical protein